MSRRNQQQQQPAPKSLELVETAEELVEALERLSVCLRHVEEKYVDKGNNVDQKSSLFLKMKENLEVAQNLMDTLKQQKWRLSRREMSVELRAGELEEYKTNMKRDMTDMNQTVEVLSVRVVQLENALCEEQEKQESLEAEKKETFEMLTQEQKKTKALEGEVADLKAQIKTLKLKRTDSQLRQITDDMTNKVEMLMLENHSLKEMIRDREKDEEKLHEQLKLEKESHALDKRTVERDDKVKADLNQAGLIRDTEIAYV